MSSILLRNNNEVFLLHIHSIRLPKSSQNNLLTGFSGFIFFVVFLGTCKLERNCTATLKAVSLDNSKVQVESCCTHYGHAKEVEHVWTTQAKRSEIAAKLKQGISKEKILDNIRDNVGTSLLRDDLTL